MWKFIVIVCLQVAAAVITFITTTGLMRPSFPRQIFGRSRDPFTRKGWILLITYLFIIAFSVYQLIEETREERRALKAAVRKEKEYQKETDRKTAEAEARSNRRNDATVRSIVEALARYNLRMDSNNQEIVKMIRDSARRQTIIQGPLPTFDFCVPDGIRLESRSGPLYNFVVSFCDGEVPVSGFNIHVYIVVETFTGKIYQVEGSGQLLYYYRFRFPGKKITDRRIPVLTLDSLTKVYFAMVGDFTDERFQNKSSIESIHPYDMITYKHIAPSGETYLKARNALIRDGVIKN